MKYVLTLLLVRFSVLLTKQDSEQATQLQRMLYGFQQETGSLRSSMMTAKDSHHVLQDGALSVQVVQTRPELQFHSLLVSSFSVVRLMTLTSYLSVTFVLKQLHSE